MGSTDESAERDGTAPTASDLPTDPQTEHETLLEEVTHDRILTIPNAITVARLACLPVYLWLLLAQEDRVSAAILLSVLGATDFLDGWVARRFHQESNLGRILDPTVDRLLFLVGIGGIIAVDGAPRWVCWVVLAREIVVSTITVVLTLRGAEPVRVTWFGKAGTFCLMFAFPLFLGSTSTVWFNGFLAFAAWCFTIPGLAFSYYAFACYIPEWRAALAEAKAWRAQAHPDA